MSDIWIDPRTPAGSTLHGVHFDDRHGVPIGWVEWDRADRVWRAFCRVARCHEVGQGYRRESAGELVREHWLGEHR